jgi:glutathione-regulated potassium-efflux system protein KefB
VSQVLLCGALLTAAGIAAGLAPAVAFVAGMGFVLSSTAVVMQMLEERGDVATPAGQRAVSILLLEDLAIVPLLAAVAFIAPVSDAGSQPRWLVIATGIASILALFGAGRWLLNPMFGILAAARAREVMTAAALLVVLGAALLMEFGGLSMAMGAFLAGVLLSESSFRHQLEADIEPFRGILLGIFFIAVAMSLDLTAILADWRLILLALVVFTVVKGFGIYTVARVFGADNREAIDRVTLFAQGGEFAFVLYSAATANGIFDARHSAIFTATIILSMALTPLLASLIRQIMPAAKPSMDGIEAAEGLRGSLLIIGFGRFAQIACQSLLARGCDVTLIENDPEMIQAASDFGFKVYYGDGTRLDILRASGAGQAQAILVCVDKREAATRIAELASAEFPQARLFVRSYDRGHTLDLLQLGVEYEIRETFESAMAFGATVLSRLGVPQEDVEEITSGVRRRDQERLELQMVGGIRAGVGLLFNNTPTPAPLTPPRQRGQVIGDVPAKPGEPKRQSAESSST